MAKKVCSFCGRGEDEVRLLITGMNGFICENCAQQAYQIAQSAGALDADEYEVEIKRIKHYLAVQAEEKQHWAEFVAAWR